MRTYAYVSDDPVDWKDSGTELIEDHDGSGGGPAGGPGAGDVGGGGGGDTGGGDDTTPPPNDNGNSNVGADDPNYIFRGDDRYVRGNPMGQVLDSEHEPPEAREFMEHVQANLKRGKISRFLSFTRSVRTATRFTKANRIYRVQFKELRRLEQAGEVRIYNADQVRDLMEKDPDPAVRNQANNVRRNMERNQEILVEGQIPATLISRAR